MNRDVYLGMNPMNCYDVYRGGKYLFSCSKLASARQNGRKHKATHIIRDNDGKVYLI